MTTKPCQKVGYASREDALLAIANWWARPARVFRVYMQTGKIPTRAYLCVCGQWHLTSKSDRNSDAEKTAWAS